MGPEEEAALTLEDIDGFFFTSISSAAMPALFSFVP